MIEDASREDVLTKDQMKYAQMGIDIENLSVHLSQSTGFVNHLKKLARVHEEEFLEGTGNDGELRRRSTVRVSPSKSPSLSPDPLRKQIITKPNKMNQNSSVDSYGNKTFGRDSSFSNSP